MLCSAGLTPLAKGEDDVRPIAFGELLCRVAAKTILRHLFKTDSLLPFQFGVRSQGGVESILPCIELASQMRMDAGFTLITSLDFSNAFNSVSRDHIANGINTFAPDFLNAARWAYGFESDHFMKTGEGAPLVIKSSSDVRQGDPFGPLFFSLAVRPFLQGLSLHLGPDHLVLAYLDDIFILGPGGGALQQVNAFLSDRRSPLSLNPAKCWEQRLDDLRDNGAEILGSLIGPRDRRAAFLASAVDQQRQLIARLSSFPNSMPCSLSECVFKPTSAISCGRWSRGISTISGQSSMVSSERNSTA